MEENMNSNNQLNDMNYNSSPNKRNNKLLIILVVSTIIIIAIVFLILFVFKKGNKTDNNSKINDEDRNVVEKEMSKEEAEELTEPFEYLYFDENLNDKIVFTDYYDFDSIPNDLKIDIAVRYLYDKFYDEFNGGLSKEFTKEDINSSLKVLFNKTENLTMPKSLNLNRNCSSMLWNEEKQIYELPKACGGVITYLVFSKNIDIKYIGQSKVEIYKKYILSEKDFDKDNERITKITYYSDGNRQNIIGTELDGKEIDIDELLDQGDLYKITFTKDGDNYYFESMEKQIDDDLGSSLLPDEISEYKIDLLLNLLNGASNYSLAKYKKFNSDELITNATFTMKQLRNNKKLYSTDINDYIKALSLFDLKEANEIELSEDKIEEYACDGYAKLDYCNKKENEYKYELDSYGIYMYSDLNEFYKSGISKIDNFYTNPDNFACRNKIVYALNNEKKILYFEDQPGCGGLYDTSFYWKINDVKTDDKVVKIYLKAFEEHLDNEYEYIQSISNLMSNNHIGLPFKAEVRGYYRVQLNVSQILNIFKKYDDKLETLAFTFEKNSNGNYVFDYVELVD